MPELVSKLFEPLMSFLQHNFLRTVLLIAGLGWTIILLPQEVFDLLQISNLRLVYAEMIGSLTFVATFLFSFGLLAKTYGWLKEKWNEHAKSLQNIRILNQLTPIEHQYLKRYIDDRSQTVTFTVFDGVVAGLIEKDILYKADSQPNRAGEQDFNLYPWAYNYLVKHYAIASEGVSHDERE